MLNRLLSKSFSKSFSKLLENGSISDLGVIPDKPKVCIGCGSKIDKINNKERLCPKCGDKGRNSTELFDKLLFELDSLCELGDTPIDIIALDVGEYLDVRLPDAIKIVNYLFDKYRKEGINVTDKLTFYRNNLDKFLSDAEQVKDIVI